MVLQVYRAERPVQRIEDPFDLSQLDAVGMALGVARASRECEENEEMARFSAFVSLPWFVLEPFSCDFYFERVFPELVTWAIGLEGICFNLTDIAHYHSTTIGELRVVVDDPEAMAKTRCYIRDNLDYLQLSENDAGERIQCILG